MSVREPARNSQRALGPIDHQAQINAEKHGGGRRGKEIKKASFHWSLSRHPGQEKLTEEEWLEKVNSYLDEIGLGHHYTVIVEHTDEPQDHIHGITSLIDPETGKLNKKAVSNIKLRSSRAGSRSLNRRRPQADQ